MKIELKEATINDAEILFIWANDPETRQNSFCSKAIEWNNHIKWLNKKLIDPASKIYIFHFNGKPIGVVRFELRNKAIVGVTVAPDQRGKGLGVEIIYMACERYWENNDCDILAYIKKGNIPSQRVFEKAGFTFLREDIVNKIECLILEAKKNVNR